LGLGLLLRLARHSYHGRVCLLPRGRRRPPDRPPLAAAVGGHPLTTPVPALPDSYLRAILALPDDDGPRLCAADWWDEQGAAERAEFVRVQCELARRYPGWSGVPSRAPELADGAGGSYAELRRRERELWRAGGDTDGGRFAPA
jgi:uncharacterized protein (TIGR02996 family)